MDENIIIENETNEKKEEKSILICADCGREIDTENEEYFETKNGDIICSDCRDEYYITCEGCGELIHIDDTIEAEDTSGYWCDDCAQDNFSTCDCCGEWFHNDELTYNSNDDCYYCADCYDECDDYDDFITSYHEHKGQYEFYKTDKEAKKPLYFGFELEVEQGIGCSIYNNNEEAKNIYDLIGDLVFYERDGSLNNGFEIISHPQTFKYIMKNRNKYKTMLQHLIDNKYISHNSNNCGLHIHLTRDYFTTNEIDKLQLLIEKFKNELTIFSRRTPQQISHWSSFISDKHNTDTEPIDIKYIKKYKDNYNRYYALNLTNSNTIEFRLLRGTLKYNTFIASFELLNNMVKIVKNTSVKNIDTLKFEDIVNYGKNNKHLKTYCIEKNLIKKEVL